MEPQHHPECHARGPGIMPPHMDCTCGLDALREKAKQWDEVKDLDPLWELESAPLETEETP